MTTRSREELERALRDLGVRCAIESYDALAVAIPEPGERRLAIDDVRRRALELARTHGFSHLAVELREDEGLPIDRAPLSGD
jgi:sugar phosphate isomerase/epimerase